MISGNWDLKLLLALNSLVGSNGLYIWDLANNALVRGFPIFFAWSRYGFPAIAENGVAGCWPGCLQSV
jgi:hypothetical protein